MVLDVFDASGTFEKQVALEGDHQADRDAVILLPNGRIVVIVGALDAWLNQQGAGANAEEAPEAGTSGSHLLRIERKIEESRSSNC